MTNNLKILTILSIFVFILTGYFCFFSSFTKNQIITNNNDEEKKDGKETTIDTNNKDNNNNEKKDNEEKASERSILNIAILIVILIIAIVVIVFIIVNKFKFNEDFTKENFCPTFFLISTLVNNKGILTEFRENGDCFFEILAKYILSRNAINASKDIINKVEIYLSKCDDDDDIIDNTYNISLGTILCEISTFAAFSKDVSNEKVNEIVSSYSEGINMNELHTTSKYIENKYGEEFDSYLCSYILYYLAKEIRNKKKVKIHNCKTKIYHNNKRTYNTSFTNDKSLTFTKKYNVDFEIMDKILEKLFKHKPLDNVEYEYS